MTNIVEPWEALVSLLLLATAIAFSVRYKLGIELSLTWASFRAAVQLVAVGAVLTMVVEAGSLLWAWMWVGFMIAVASWTVQRRVPDITRVWAIALIAIGGATVVVLAILFGLGIFELEPIPLVVVAGITIGNTMPATVQAADQVRSYVRDHPGRIEALLALGFDGKGSMRFLVQQVARTALLPQIERTKVVGLIALPGAMTGLLLGGVDPADAVLVQLVIMYLVLGSVATSVAIVTTATARRTLTPDLRLRQM